MLQFEKRLRNLEPVLILVQFLWKLAGFWWNQKYNWDTEIRRAKKQGKAMRTIRHVRNAFKFITWLINLPNSNFFLRIKWYYELESDEEKARNRGFQLLFGILGKSRAPKRFVVSAPKRFPVEERRLLFLSFFFVQFSCFFFKRSHRFTLFVFRSWAV